MYTHRTAGVEVVGSTNVLPSRSRRTVNLYQTKRQYIFVLPHKLNDTYDQGWECVVSQNLRGERESNKRGELGGEHLVRQEA